MKEIKLTDIKGVKVGQYENQEAATGCSVVIVENGATAGVDVRGGGPATRETDLLNPINMVQQIHAVMLSGGSAFGLDAASGVMQYLEEHGVGFDMSVGNYGAGCGASVGKLLGFEHAMKGGIGTYGLQVGNVQVAGIVAVNACGNVIDYQTQEILAGVNIDKKCVSASQIILDQMDQLRKLPDGNTTIACLVTNVKLTKAQCTKIAGISHNGYAKSIDPVHTMSDGDTIFVLSTNEVDGMVDAVGILAVEVISKCIQRAIKKAKSGYGLLAYQDLKK